MKKDINFNDFVDSFSESYKDNFSYDGKKALYEYLLNYEEETDTEIELDPIRLCCEYTEYNTLSELQIDYPDIKTMEELEENTMIIPITNLGKKTDAFIVQQF